MHIDIEFFQKSIRILHEHLMFCILKNFKIMNSHLFANFLGILNIQIIPISVIYIKIYITVLVYDVTYGKLRVSSEINHVPERILSTWRQFTHQLKIVCKKNSLFVGELKILHLKITGYITLH